MFGDENLQLIELSQKVLFELGDEASATHMSEIEYGHNDDLIQIDSGFSLPDSAEWEIALLGSQATKPSHQSSLDIIEGCVGDGMTGIIGQRKVQIVAAGRPSHR